MIDTGRVMPQIGERWRLRIRLFEGPNPWVCTHCRSQNPHCRIDQDYEGQVFTVIPVAPVWYCVDCDYYSPTPEGTVAIRVPDWRRGYSGMTVDVQVPYVWLEPEEWGRCKRKEGL